MIEYTRLYKGLPAVLKGDKYLVFTPYAMKVAHIPESIIDTDEIYTMLKNNSFFDTSKSSKHDNSDEIRGTLCTTQRCNLNCEYCFVANESGITAHMSQALAVNSTKELIRRAKGKKRIVLSFFGGEPSLNMKAISASVSVIKDYSADTGVESWFEIRSNGVMNKQVLDYLIKNNFKFGLSIDGPPHIQDTHRPSRSGNRSSEIAERTLDYLGKKKIRPVIRSTITDYSVSMIGEIVEYFSNYGIKSIHFEPMAKAGRGMRTKGKIANAPDPDVFVDNFIDALDKGKRYGISIKNSAYLNLFKHSQYYCQALTGNHLIVTPEGKISYCMSIQDECHPLADMYLVGSYDKKRGHFIFDNSKIENIKRLIDTKINNKCSNCFARYSCGGGCPFHTDYHCKIKKKLLCLIINRMVNEKKGE